MPDLSKLPPDFTWGVATAAYQIEGAVGRTAASRPSGTPSAGYPVRSTTRTPATSPATTTTGGPRTSS
ncbi:family 1 glycosylhydrolase [Phytohabitans flavus]|uniref:family 1 glycosylhydrolase n=1 Tax=Phytohabitans flavus TaxID=1076124 RepID=UPI003629902F